MPKRPATPRPSSRLRAGGGRAGAAIGAHREAAAHYARALRVRATGCPPDARAALLEGRSHECYLTDQTDESIDALEQAIAVRRAIGDRRGEAAALSLLSRRLWCGARTDDATRVRARGRTPARRAAARPRAGARVQQPGRSSPQRRAPRRARRSTWARHAAMQTWPTGPTRRHRGDRPQPQQPRHDRSCSRASGTGGTSWNAAWPWPSGAGSRGARRPGLHPCRLGDDPYPRLRPRTVARPGHRRCATSSAWRAGGSTSWRTGRGSTSTSGRWDDAADDAAFVLRSAESVPLLRILALTILGLGPGPPRRPGAVAAAGRGARAPRRPGRASVPRAGRRRPGPKPPGCEAAATPSTTPPATSSTRPTTGRRPGSSASSPGCAAWPASERAVPAAAEPVPSTSWPATPRAAAARWERQGCPYDAALALIESADEDDLRRALADVPAPRRPPRRRDRRTPPARARRARPAARPPPGDQTNPARLTRREAEVLTLVRRAPPTRRSPPGCSCRRRPCTTTSRRSCASSASTAAARPSPRPSRRGITAPNLGIPPPATWVVLPLPGTRPDSYGCGANIHHREERTCRDTSSSGPSTTACTSPSTRPARHLPGRRRPQRRGGCHLDPLLRHRATRPRPSACTTPRTRRRSARQPRRNALPVDQISEVRVLDPYFYSVRARILTAAAVAWSWPARRPAPQDEPTSRAARQSRRHPDRPRTTSRPRRNSPQALAKARAATAKYVDDLPAAMAAGYQIITADDARDGLPLPEPEGPGLRRHHAGDPRLRQGRRRLATRRAGVGLARTADVDRRCRARPTARSTRPATTRTAPSCRRRRRRTARRPTRRRRRFGFWHPKLVTMHVWLWFHNPAGLYHPTNPLIQTT